MLANNPDGYGSDTTNLGSKDGKKTDTMSKRTLKTNIIAAVSCSWDGPRLGGVDPCIWTMG